MQSINKNNKSTKKNCKVAFQGELKRFTLDRADFCGLHKQLCALFPQLNPRQSVAILYAKDGKLFRIASDEALHKALKSTNNILHFRVNLPQRSIKKGPQGKARVGHPKKNLAPPRRVRKLPYRGRHVIMRGPSNPVIMGRKLERIGKFHDKGLLLQRRILPPNSLKWGEKLAKFENRCVSRPEFLRNRIVRLFQDRRIILARLAKLNSIPPRRIPHVVRIQHREKLRRNLGFVSFCLDRLLARQAHERKIQAGKVHGIPPKIVNGRLVRPPMSKDGPVPNKKPTTSISEQNRPKIPPPNVVSRECADICGKIRESLAGLHQVRQKLEHLKSERSRDTTREKMQAKAEIRGRIAHLDHLHKELRGRREFQKMEEKTRVRLPEKCVARPSA